MNTPTVTLPLDTTVVYPSLGGASEVDEWFCDHRPGTTYRYEHDGGYGWCWVDVDGTVIGDDIDPRAIIDDQRPLTPADDDDE